MSPYIRQLVQEQRDLQASQADNDTNLANLSGNHTGQHSEDLSGDFDTSFGEFQSSEDSVNHTENVLVDSQKSPQRNDKEERDPDGDENKSDTASENSRKDSASGGCGTEANEEGTNVKTNSTKMLTKEGRLG